MEGESEAPEASLFPATVGDRLRAAREGQGLDLAEVAARTRIPQRHLEAIEKSNYSALPSITYAVGFAKSYARAIGADEVAIGRELRAELGRAGPERSPPMPSYDASDPMRSPSSGAMWIGLGVALLLLIGAGIWYGTGLFRGSAPAPETLIIPEETPTPDAGNVSAIAEGSGGQVSLIAREAVWLRVTDGNGNRLFEKEMAAGERYDVPADAVRPVARTGRGEAIQVTLNGSNVPDLGRQTVEAEVSADAIRTRGQTPPPAASTSSATPPTRPATAPRQAAAPSEAGALSVSGNSTAP